MSLQSRATPLAAHANPPPIKQQAQRPMMAQTPQPMAPEARSTPHQTNVTPLPTTTTTRPNTPQSQQPPRTGQAAVPPSPSLTANNPNDDEAFVYPDPATFPWPPAYERLRKSAGHDLGSTMAKTPLSSGTNQNASPANQKLAGTIPAGTQAAAPVDRTAKPTVPQAGSRGGSAGGNSVAGKHIGTVAGTIAGPVVGAVARPLAASAMKSIF